jgi:hypothetical protein
MVQYLKIPYIHVYFFFCAASRTLIVLRFIFRTVIHFEYFDMIRGMDKSSIKNIYGCQVVIMCIEKIILSPPNCL